MIIRIHCIRAWQAAAWLIEQENGLILVDTGFPDNADRILQIMQEIGRDDLRLIYITHGHLDHYGSAASLHERTGAPIAAHEADAEAMRQGKTILGTARRHARLIEALQPFWELLPHLKADPAPPDILLKDGDDLSEFGLDAKVIHTPGHTPGSTCLLLKDKTAFVGDLLAGPGPPRQQYLYADDWAQIPHSVERLKAANPEWIYTGHSRRRWNSRECW